MRGRLFCSAVRAVQVNSRSFNNSQNVNLETRAQLEEWWHLPGPSSLREHCSLSVPQRSTTREREAKHGRN